MESQHWINGIENVIFDLGGVVIDLARTNAVQSLERLGMTDAGELLGEYRQEGPFLALETGRLTAGEFFDILRDKCPGATDKDLTQAFNAFLVRIPPKRLEMLRRMRMAGYRIFVLSNTNPVMYNSWIAEAFRAEGGSINDYFDGIVTSFEELCCKPDPEIFRRVVARYGLDPAQTLMLDDSEANCQAAAGVGLHALKVGKEEDDDMIAICSWMLANRGL